MSAPALTETASASMTTCPARPRQAPVAATRRRLASRAPASARRIPAAPHIAPSAGRSGRSWLSAALALRRIRSVSAASRAMPASVSA